MKKEITISIQGEHFDYLLSGSKKELVEVLLDSSLSDPQIDLLLAFVTFFNATKTQGD
ncbi:hypothetical protein LCGC14_2312920 [marine sediment metagenome]|uniref:Uncharacterized protein n=1 Tax=marine sediment metagenome TaxID=412755 RepID=A0A0F9FEZ8_9ZZZZ